MAATGRENLSATKLSEELRHLDEISISRYCEKLTIEGYVIPDPYSNALKWEDSVQKWPSVMYGDIYNFLINSPGLYTKEALKAYKSLEGYNYFESGHVHAVKYSCVSSDSSACILKAKVIPSQRVNDKPHEAWVCIDKEKAYVTSAHCTCKAGLGEACSHIAALLFKIERATLYGLNKESRTSVTCSWNQFYRKKVTPQPIAEIDFSKPKRTKKKKQRKSKTIDCSEEDGESLFKKLKQVHPTACVLLKDDSETDSASDDEDLPPLLHACWNLETREMGPDLEASLLRDMSVTDTQVTNLEVMTRGQHESPIWHRHRQGRITASIVHDVKTLRKNTPRTCLVQKVLKIKQKNLSTVDSVRFGIKNEKSAKDAYKKDMNVKHENFSLRECGLVLDRTCPFFAASPDGVRDCACHGSGLLEVKCSYKHRETAVSDIDDNDFFLDRDTLILKKSHRYFTQIQFQMFVCEKTFCDFVVYTKKGIHLQTIPYDPDFVQELIGKCHDFVSNDLLTEIVKQKLL